MTVAAAVASTSTSGELLWFLTRGSGLVCLVLLTAVVVLGLLSSAGVHAPQWPRFATAGLHRTLTMLTLGLLAVHVSAAVLDSYAPVGWLDVVLPFHSSYRRWWLGFGTLALDLLILLTVTSLLRVRLGYRVWRGLHWLAYACWPTAMLHGLGTGTDTKARWVLALTFGCGSAVLVALAVRLAAGWPAGRGARLAAGGAAAVLAVALVGWTRAGPLSARWARTAGTPSYLIGGRHATATSGSAPAAATAAAAGGFGTMPLQVTVSGSLTVTQLPDGTVSVALAAPVASSPAGTLSVVLTGTPLGDGGVSLSAGRAQFGPLTHPAQFTGSVTALQGGAIDARLADAVGHRLVLTLDVATDPAQGTFQGQLAVTPQ